VGDCESPLCEECSPKPHDSICPDCKPIEEEEEEEEEMVQCVGCNIAVCKMEEEPPHKDDRGEAVCEDCYVDFLQKEEEEFIPWFYKKGTYLVNKKGKTSIVYDLRTKKPIGKRTFFIKKNKWKLFLDKK
jgi:hypothetical protein